MLLVRLSDVDMHVGRVVILNASSSPSASSSACPAESNCLLRVATMNGVEGEFGEGNRMGLRARLGERQRLASGDLCRFNMIGNLGSILAGVNRTEEARSVLERFVHEARRSGLAAFEAIGLADLGQLNLLEHDYEAARAAYSAALTQLRSRAAKYYEKETLRGLGLASLGLGQRDEARAAFAEMLELALAATRAHSAYVAGALSGIALAADPAAADRAARLRGAVAQLNSDADVVMNAYLRAEDELERHFERQLVVLLGQESVGTREDGRLNDDTRTGDRACALAFQPFCTSSRR